MAAIIILGYFGGLIVAGFVFRACAGLGVNRRLQILGSNGVGVAWMTVTMLKTLVWPMVLIVWIATGRPEPRVVFNEKAAARRRKLQSDVREAGA